MELELRDRWRLVCKDSIFHVLHLETKLPLPVILAFPRFPFRIICFPLHYTVETMAL